MFSFHKPKVYRSTAGCCICKAKSSSSRFTDSKKYELDFIECFQLSTPRQGEICNACVLLVKRFKRLPPDSDRHWGHVVDARVGPGLKSMTKFKKRKEEQYLKKNGGGGGGIDTDNTRQMLKDLQDDGIVKSSLSMSERFGKIFKKTKKKKIIETVITRSAGSSDDNSSPGSPASQPSDDLEEIHNKKITTTSTYSQRGGKSSDDGVILNNNYHQRISQRKNNIPRRRRQRIMSKSIIEDDELWTKHDTCCGIIYEHKMIKAILIDSSTKKLCSIHNNQLSQTMKLSPTLSNHSSLSSMSSSSSSSSSSLSLSSSSSASSSSSSAAVGSGATVVSTTGAATTTTAGALITVQPTTIKYLSPTTIINSSVINTEQIKSIIQITNNNLLTNSCGGGGVNKQKITSQLYSSQNGGSSKLQQQQQKHQQQHMYLNLVGNNINCLNNEITQEKRIDYHVNGNKINDNSCDSGFDEIVNETSINASTSSDKGFTRPLILANGIKLHVQPRNIVLSTNLSGVTHLLQANNMTKPPMKTITTTGTLNKGKIISKLPLHHNIVNLTTHNPQRSGTN